MLESVRGSLTVVGVGIALGQTTLEAKVRTLSRLTRSSTWSATRRRFAGWSNSIPTAESLYGLYASGKERLQTYSEMADRILVAVRARQTVVSAFYGHPGVFADPVTAYSLGSQ